MKKHMRIFSCALALIMMTAGLAGQAPADLVKEIEWQDLTFNKAIVSASFSQGPAAAKNMLDLGAAFKAGSVYVGSYYKGNLGSYTGKEEQKVTTALTQAGGIITNTQTTSTFDLNKTYTNADHTVNLLAGFGKMGVKLGYTLNGSNRSGTYFHNTTIGNFGTFSDNIVENTNGTFGTHLQYSPKGFNNNTVHTPSIAFGTKLEAGRFTLTPSAALELEIKQNGMYGLKTETNKNNANSYTITKTATKQFSIGGTVYNHNYGTNYYKLGLALGTGIALKDALSSEFTAAYKMGAYFYANNYKDATGAQHKTGTYTIEEDTSELAYNQSGSGKSITTDTFKARFNKSNRIDNTLTLGYAVKKDIDRLSLSAGIECPVAFNFHKEVSEQKDTKVVKTVELNPSNAHLNSTVVTTKTRPVMTQNTTTVEVKPLLKAGVKYAARPNLSLKMNSKIKFLQGTYTEKKTSWDSFVEKTETVTTKADGTVTRVTTAAPANRQETLTKDGSHTQVNAELTGGFTWNITDSFIFDVEYTGNLLDGNILWDSFDKLKLGCTVKF